MAFLSGHNKQDILDKLCDDDKKLRKYHKKFKLSYYEYKADLSEVKDYQEDGYKIDEKRPLKIKQKWMVKPKDHSVQFEDNVWCLFKDLGYEYLNYDNQFKLPFGKEKNNKQQIDVVAVDKKDKVVFLVECKSKKENRKTKSFKSDFDMLGAKIHGFTNSIHELFGRDYKVKYIFATSNIGLGKEDLERLKMAKAFLLDEIAFEYISNLIRTYKEAAKYQFLGLLFQGEKINKDKIAIPAVKGVMGKEEYYMFALEPETLLKSALVLHRSAIHNEFPSYQRLLVPSRLKSINDFVEKGGYFPNSIIINFNSGTKVEFESVTKTAETGSSAGILKIPNAYAMAYVIDGQHRLYGYALNKFKYSETIPVVAFSGLKVEKQLELFLDINEGQKSVKKSLRTDLVRHLLWDSERIDSRMVALRSAIVADLTEKPGPLFGKISLGELLAKNKISAVPFNKAILRSTLLPAATQKKYKSETVAASLYDTTNLDHPKAMISCKLKVVSFINHAYLYVENHFNEITKVEHIAHKLIYSARGVYPYVVIVGKINNFLTKQGEVDLLTENGVRFDKIKKYLKVLLNEFVSISEREIKVLLEKQGQGAEKLWLNFYQEIINKAFPEYLPDDLIEWRKQQKEESDNNAPNSLKIDIEKHVKTIVMDKLHELYGDSWSLYINQDHVKHCMNQAQDEKTRIMKNENRMAEVSIESQFQIYHYKDIVMKHFSELGDYFSYNYQDDPEFNSRRKEGKLSWMDDFIELRNILAHEGTREGLTGEQLDRLEKIHSHIFEE